MASLCTTLFWITRRHRVCRDGTVERGLSETNSSGGGDNRAEKIYILVPYLPSTWELLSALRLSLPGGAACIDS